MKVNPVMLFSIIIAAVTALSLLGYWLSRPTRGNPISKWIRSFFNTAKEQSVIHIGDDRVVRKEDYKISLPTYITNKDGSGTWHQVYSLALRIAGFTRHVLILTNTSTVPINPFVSLSSTRLAKLMDNHAIAEECAFTALHDSVRNAKNNQIASALIICVCAVVLVFLIFMGYTFWKSGGVSIKGITG